MVALKTFVRRLRILRPILQYAASNMKVALIQAAPDDASQ